MIRSVRIAAVATLLCFGTAGAATPPQKCQGTKNQAAGKYAACRQTAEKILALKGDTAKYGSAIAKCERTFATAWEKAIDKAAKAGATCLDAPLVEAEFKAAIDAHADTVATALGGAGWWIVRWTSPPVRASWPSATRTPAPAPRVSRAAAPA